ncbi:MAG: hypothetical protein E6H09_15935 [Bacteroidetes bacterium]|nr:MAG: hypothetical protein E6H09_15935 [Bacteroidota bacterium]
MSSFFPIKRNIDSLLAAAAGFTIILFFTRHGGIGIEPDSVEYLSVAENLHAKGELVDFTGAPLVDFPAFYPFFLSCFMWVTGLNPLNFAPLLNALLFSLVIILAGYIMDRFVYTSRVYKWAILTCIVISPCLLEVYSMLMSESLFLLLLLLFIISIHRYSFSFSRRALFAAILCAALASVTRYAGITLIATGGILLLINSKVPLRKKLIDVLLYALLSPSLLIINLARNHIVSGNLTGGREISTTSLRENIHDAGSVLYDWLPFLQGHYRGAGILFIIVIAGLVFLCINNYRHIQNFATYENIATSFSLLYLLFMVSIASVSRFETLNSRFLAPVFIPLLWCSSYWIVPLFQKTGRSGRILVLVAAGCMFCLFQYGQLAWDAETWDGVKDAGIPGYTEDQWRYSETVQFIKNDSLLFRKDFTVYSDASDAIFFFTGKVGQFLPHRQYPPGIKEFLSNRHCYVVWFDDGENTDLVDKAFITGTKKMKLLKQFNDGAVYVYDQ